MTTRSKRSAAGQPLNNICFALERIAPLELAESWDPVGLLIEPLSKRPVRCLLLAIDLTASVMDEAIKCGAECLVIYHPPLFQPISRLAASDPHTHQIMRAVQHNIAIYSPHTALDAAEGGVADWLCEALGEGSCAPIISSPREASPIQHGPGRLLRLARPARLKTLQRRLKGNLGIPSLRVSACARHTDGREPIRSIAVCPGAGGEVLLSASADLYFTGEMKHHEVLAAREKNTSVILCEHTRTERGYLPLLADRLRAILGEGVDVRHAEADRELIEDSRLSQPSPR